MKNENPHQDESSKASTRSTDSSSNTNSTEAKDGQNFDEVRESLIGKVSAASYQTWSHDKELRNNIRQGKHWRNQPSPITPPERHSPSQLQQCHRRIVYRQLNAPEESADPSGIFWIGSKFEQERMVPYLEAIAPPDAYVRNSMWVDYEIDTDHGPLKFRGETDPVIVNEDSSPLLVTEIKTKRTLANLDEPNQHHIAQVYAYMEGLSRNWETDVRDALLIYGSRTTLDIEIFHLEFTGEVWEELVVEWADRHTKYRLEDALPPARPAFDWECGTCSYRHRCGQGDSRFSDIGAEGFLPSFDQYPETKVVEYLDEHENAHLTPTLAAQLPHLTEQYDVSDWRCQRCAEQYSFNTIEWENPIDEPPLCPACRSDGLPVTLVECVPEVEE